ncbi:hypothetical protein ACIBG0_40310 [Nocardia sp. NPDC050630]|uniref:hypothetical protein n=1 Tax=Nocardia sp. NPDC050630 TaxID=3364321 RepID=UPI0037A64803
MTDHSPEDELIAEARKFGYAMKEMLRLHAQAGNWLERRRIRKQISLTLREQRRSEQADRKNQLVWTQQMIDRYRAHSLAVAERAADPRVDHQRRYRDVQALTRHADDLRSRVVGNARLTRVEQGIALDGVDAATVFPQFEPGRLFDKAHKVRGIEALRYRAQVARTVRDQAQTSQHERIQRAPQYEASLRWDSATGQDPIVETRGFDSARDGLEWMYRDIDHAMWVDGQTVDASLRDPAGRQLYHRHGDPEMVAEQLEHPLGIIRGADGGYRQNPRTGFFADADTLADHQRTVADAATEQRRATVERPPQHEAAKPFVANVGPTDVYVMDGREFAKLAPQDRDRMSRFETREQGYDWILHQLDNYRDTSSRAGGDFTATIQEDGRSRSAEVVEGPLGMVTDEVRALRDQHQRRQRGQATEQPVTRPVEQQSAAPVDPDRFAEFERQLKDISIDRDRLENRVGLLQRGLDAVTADRDEFKRNLAAAEGRIEELKNRNIRLANEIGELRDRPKVDQVAAERDRYKRERDEAVQKLAQTLWTQRNGRAADRAEQTQRNGEEQHVVIDTEDNHTAERAKPAERLDDTQPWRPIDVDHQRAERNGQRRNGIERSR